MGQSLRRATGRIGTVKAASQLKKPVDRGPLPQPERAAEKVSGSNVGPGAETAPTDNGGNVLEGRDRQYDAMLNQMVGRIRAKPGGKLEMGEAVVVEKYDRPMPKLRNTTPDSTRYEERPAPPGTLNVAQLRQIMLLYQGKADDHDGPMDVPQIAERFRIDVAQVQRIVQSVSLLPEDSSKTRNET